MLLTSLISAEFISPNGAPVLRLPRPQGSEEAITDLIFLIADILNLLFNYNNYRRKSKIKPGAFSFFLIDMIVKNKQAVL